MSDKSNLLMFGATGTIGKYIIEAIVNDRDSFGRIAIFTSAHTVSSKPDELNALRQKGVDILIGDVGNREDVLKAYAGTLLPQLALPSHMHLKTNRLHQAWTPSSPHSVAAPLQPRSL